jgi:hypothetical protein
VKDDADGAPRRRGLLLRACRWRGEAGNGLRSTVLRGREQEHDTSLEIDDDATDLCRRRVCLDVAEALEVVAPVDGEQRSKLGERIATPWRPTR